MAVQPGLCRTRLETLKTGFLRTRLIFSSRDSKRKHYFGKKHWCDLENEVKVTKIYSTLFPLPIMKLCKFGENPPTGKGKGDRVAKRLIFTFFIHVDKVADLENNVKVTKI